MLAPIRGTLLITQGFASLRGGPDEAYTVDHGGTLYRCIGHPAYDINATIGTPVYAVKSGVVHFFGAPWNFPDDGYAPLGLHAVLTLPTGETYWFAHLSAASVPDGASVTQGETIALTGNTGNVIGTGHLHMAYRPVHPDMNSGFDGFSDFIGHFNYAVYPLIDLSLV